MNKFNLNANHSYLGRFWQQYVKNPIASTIQWIIPSNIPKFNANKYKNESDKLIYKKVDIFLSKHTKNIKTSLEHCGNKSLLFDYYGQLKAVVEWE